MRAPKDKHPKVTDGSLQRQFCVKQTITGHGGYFAMDCKPHEYLLGNNICKANSS